jgi:RNA polymerase sigma factor (sigma-70 family)
MRNIKQAGGGFPATRLSLIDALRSPEPEVRTNALDLVVAAYWRPTYKYIRIRYHRSPEDAEDLTQGFFTRVVEKDFLAGYDSGKARFRTFLRVCLDRFVANQFQAQERVKRGGGKEVVPLDFAGAEVELQGGGAHGAITPEECFEREWIRSLFSRAIDALRARAASQGKALQLRIFEQYDLEGDSAGEKVTYGSLAREHGLSTTEVTNYLADMRRQFRAEVLESIRELTAGEEDFRREVRDILGIGLK